ncbi:MAG: alginate O-acetylation protein [Alphaproteobacteria bacterium]|nr:MAG: alginate O-acetylation protein [Alphaproteobacteria bacterium]
MLFSSLEFIFLFLPLVLATDLLFWRLGLERLAIVWLLAASLFFYCWWDPRYGLLLGASILVNYGFGWALAAPRTRRLSVLWAGIVFNVGLLAYFKYANFFVDSLNAAGLSDLHLTAILLPLGISFFTFQQIAYLVDTWRGDAHDRNLVRYALFVTFFPHLIAGPLVHHAEMMRQFTAARRRLMSWDTAASGLGIFTVGVFKKVVIADGLSAYSTPVFAAADAGLTVSTIEGWIGALAYTFQLYNDFSGYSDMAIGIALLFGIRLPLNFLSPYRTRSVTEFWRRWHVTLSRFLRDYLYIPLGGNRRGRAASYRNLMITMVLGGFWHGASVTFLVWGALHGAYLVAERLVRDMRGRDAAPLLPVPLAWFLTFLAVVVGWVFFRAETLQGAGDIIAGMIGASGSFASLDNLGAARFEVGELTILLGVSIASALVLPTASEFFLERRTLVRFAPNAASAIVTLIGWGFIVMSLGGRSEFLYFQF